MFMRLCPAAQRNASPHLWSTDRAVSKNAGSALRLKRIPPPGGAFVSPDGWIVDRATCRASRNGGCFQRMHAHSWNPYEDGVRHHACVISLATQWGDATYHFPMEALVGLAAVPASLLKRCAVHVTRRRPYVEAWLAAITGRPPMVIDGAIAAADLYLPELGHCGRAQRAHVEWLRLHVTSFVERNRSYARPKGTLLLVERTAIVAQHRKPDGVHALEVRKTLSSPQQLAKKRIIANFEDGVVRPAAQFALAHGLELVNHKDSSLPPLWDQLERFANARVVLAPLGAAEVMMLAAKAGTCLVELQEAEWQPSAIQRDGHGGTHQPSAQQPTLVRNDSTYKHLADMLGQRYVRVLTKHWVADPDAVSAGLAQCHLLGNL